MPKARQGFASVFAAEMSRSVLKPKRLVFAALFAIAAIAVFAGQLAVTNWASSAVQEVGSDVDMSAIDSVIGFSLPTSVLALCFGLYAASFAARDFSDGTVMATLVAIPKRTTLFLSRLLPWVLLALLFSAIAIFACLGIGGSRMGDISAVAPKAALSALVVVCTAICGFCCGSVTKKGSLAVFLFLGLWTLAPMALGIAGGAGPEVLQKAVSYLNLAMPGNCFPMLPELVDGVSAGDNTLLAAALTAIWTVGFPVLADILFAKRATLGR